MKAKLVLFLLSICIISACVSGFGQKLYPVQGPAAEQTPPPAFAARLTGTNSGNITLVQSNGETFIGRWAIVRPSFVDPDQPGTPAGDPPQPNLAAAWDVVYGQGYFLANVLGEPIGQAIVTGNQGTVLQLEFFNQHKGVAMDNKSNIYKIVW
jgi:hypothetical protein